MKTHADKDSDAAAVKKEVILQPPAIQAPYPMRSPPEMDLNVCLSELILLNLNEEKQKADSSAPANNAIFLKFEPMPDRNISSDLKSMSVEPEISMSAKGLSQ